MSKYETVNVTRDGAVARVAFARPDSLNAMNGQMRREFYAAAREINMDDAIRVVVLTGEGRAFGAGADLADDSGGSGIMAGAQTRDDLVHEFKPGVLAIAEAPKVWVAAINGPCAGISYSYAMACDLVVMADDAYLYQPFSAIGLIPDGGSTWLLHKLIGSRRAFELMVLGEKLGADKALEWGMANRVFDKAAFPEEAMAFAEDLAGRSPLALRYTKEALRFAATASLGDTIVKEADLQEFCISSEDCPNAVAAFFDKKPYAWKGR
jgi:2-(1,2-epoxy-1,2-dihydrophenyl)acetyl-CoA isomerase